MPAARPLAAVFAAGLLVGCTSGAGNPQVQGSFPAGSTTTTVVAPTSTTRVGTTTTAATTTTTPAPSTTLAPQVLHWRSCGSRLQCGTLVVPLDYADPSRGGISLFVERRRASRPSRRIGSLLVNPGGPGVAGTQLVEQARDAFSPILLQRFDIVSWDPRGTGRSDPVRCPERLDPYLTLDPTPDSPPEKQALITAGHDFAGQCAAASGSILPSVSTQATARDMEELRKALGENTISYFGFSYGSELGATYATLFPHSVRAMVLDGAADPNEGAEAEARAQAAGLERGLDNLLASCAASVDCPFHNGGDPEGALDRLLVQLDRAPLHVGTRVVNQAIAYTAIVSSLYTSDDWSLLTEALAAAQRGDGHLLLQMFDEYYGRSPNGTYSSLFGANTAIDCLDDPGPKDIGYPDRLAAELEKAAPRLGEYLAYDYYCTFWPVEAPKLRLTGAGAGPIVVVGTTGDPITPIESSRHLASDLERGVLVTVVADQHTGYQANTCITNTVDQYLLAHTVPPPGLVCQ